VDSIARQPIEINRRRVYVYVFATHLLFKNSLVTLIKRSERWSVWIKVQNNEAQNRNPRCRPPSWILKNVIYEHWELLTDVVLTFKLSGPNPMFLFMCLTRRMDGDNLTSHLSLSARIIPSTLRSSLAVCVNRAYRQPASTQVGT